MTAKKSRKIANEGRIDMGVRPISVAEQRATAKLRRRRAAALSRELHAINKPWMDSPTIPSETRNERAREAVRRHLNAGNAEQRALYDAFTLQA